MAGVTTQAGRAAALVVAASVVAGLVLVGPGAAPSESQSVGSQPARPAAPEVSPAAPVASEAAPAAPPSPVVGDFDADRRADLMWYGRGPELDHGWFGAPGRRFVGQPLTVSGNYLPLTGDFNGDAHDDVFWYGSGDAGDYVWFGGAGRSFTGRRPVVSGAYQPFVGDFNGDGRDDVFWYQPGPGIDVVWYGRADGTFVGQSVTFAGTQAPVAGDFDGNGTTDIVWYGAGAAPDALWRGLGGGGFSGAPLRVRDQYTPRVGDFNGDRRSDIFWFGPGDAPDVVWYGTGGSFSGTAVQANSPSVPLIGDFDGNARSDLVWYQPGPAPDEIWFGRRSGFGVRALAVNRTYTPIVADFDGDRRHDILWYSPGSPADPIWYGGARGVFSSKSSIVDLYPALAPPVDRARVRTNYDVDGILAHEMGPTPEGASYTSSLEAFIYNYARGFRVFEADFVRLADGSALAAHDGMERAFGLTRDFDEVTRADMAGRHFSSHGELYTPLFSDDVVRLMRDHPDMYVVLDTKYDDVAIFARVLRDAGGDPGIMERVIPHVYDQAQLDAIQDRYPVHSFMVGLYRSQYYNRMDDPEAVSFVRRNRAPAVMMWAGQRDPSLSLRENMLQKRRYTDTFAAQLRAAGAVPWVHSIGRTADAAAFRAKRVGIYSSGPFPPYSAPQPDVLPPEYADGDEG